MNNINKNNDPDNLLHILSDDLTKIKFSFQRQLTPYRKRVHQSSNDEVLLNHISSSFDQVTLLPTQLHN